LGHGRFSLRGVSCCKQIDSGAAGTAAHSSEGLGAKAECAYTLARRGSTAASSHRPRARVRRACANGSSATLSVWLLRLVAALWCASARRRSCVQPAGGTHFRFPTHHGRETGENDGASRNGQGEGRAIAAAASINSRFPEASSA
jgi:hypothetical protein